jgi:hypothetical protein
MDAYALAHYLLDRAFQNALIDRLLKLNKDMKFFPGEATLNRFWFKTPDGCAMKRLVVRCYAKKLKKEEVVEVAGEVPAAFMLRLVEDMAVARDQGAKAYYPTVKHSCDHHEHDEKASMRPGCLKSDQA